MLLAGRFEVGPKVTAGGMGTIHRGTDRSDGTTVAVKILARQTERDAERFAREAETLRSLDHPGIVRYVAHGQEGDRHYLVMEWVAGETLEARLARGLTAAETVPIALQLADALAEVHARGLVHRDLKPNNVMLVGERVTLIDFGLARPGQQPHGLTRTGAMIGTPAYMAPEQALGRRELTPAADVFSLGCLLYECFTGRPAFIGVQFLALRAKILKTQPPPPRVLCPEMPAELDTLLRRMLAKAPGERPPDGAALVAELTVLPPCDPGPSRTRRLRPVDPDERRRVAGLATEETEPNLVSVVLAAQAEQAFGESSSSQDRAHEQVLREMLAKLGGETGLFEDGSAMLTFADAPGQAAQAALAVAALMPDAAVSVISRRPADLADALDATVHSMGAAALEAMFGVRERAVEIDEQTAGQLRGAITVERHADGRITIRK